MIIRDNRNGTIISEFPDYRKHDFAGSHYGYIVVAYDGRVPYFYVDRSGDCPAIGCSDVTDHFDFIA